MPRILTFLLAVLIPALAAAAAVHAAPNESSIAAVVNDDAISAADVSARMRLILVSSGIPDTREMRDKMRPQILNSLIDERLMMQESARLEIPVMPEDVEKGFAALAQQNNMSPDQFRSVLRREGIPSKTLNDQIAAQVAWSGVVQTALRPQVSVTEGEIDILQDRIRGDIGRAQYLVSEIFLPVENVKDESGAKQLAEKLARQVSEGKAPFSRVAQQFSQSAGASRGGDMGWIRDGELPEELDSVLTAMKQGETSRPVRSLTGYHILMVRRKDVMNEENVPSREDMHNKLGLEQLDRLQRRRLLDLKAAAFIENRAGS